jgi:hypothetical protein
MIDSKTVEQARNADIITFLEERRSLAFVRRGGAFRCKEHESLAVKSDRLSWYWHSRGVGGFGALDFLVKAEGLPFREAVEAVTGIAPAVPQPRPAAASPKTLVLPEKREIPLRLLNYLCCKRGIDGGIVDRLIQEKKLYEDKRGNVVFVGHDENGKARFASLRGTHGDCRFRMDCAGSDKRYGFHMGACAPSERLYVFESPIDAMSHASLANAEFGDMTAWEYDRRLSLAGTSDAALLFFLNRHKSVRELVFCLDNDAPGREAAANLAQKYAQMGLQARIQLPQGKDFNEDLQARMRQIRADRCTLTHQRGDVTI